jgi:hypothetical protein
MSPLPPYQFPCLTLLSLLKNYFNVDIVTLDTPQMYDYIDISIKGCRSHKDQLQAGTDPGCLNWGLLTPHVHYFSN